MIKDRYKYVYNDILLKCDDFYIDYILNNSFNSHYNTLKTLTTLNNAVINSNETYINNLSSISYVKDLYTIIKDKLIPFSSLYDDEHITDKLMNIYNTLVLYEYFINDSETNNICPICNGIGTVIYRMYNDDNNIKCPHCGGKGIIKIDCKLLNDLIQMVKDFDKFHDIIILYAEYLVKLSIKETNDFLNNTYMSYNGKYQNLLDDIINNQNNLTLNDKSKLNNLLTFLDQYCAFYNNNLEFIPIDNYDDINLFRTKSNTDRLDYYKALENHLDTLIMNVYFNTQHS